MGAWSTSINGNDTAEDLKREYAVAFWKFEVPEALRRLDEFVRKDIDEADPEEWADYIYSLADFMWKKGILTDEVRDKAIAMIDSGFGLEVWAESGGKTLQTRKKVLTAFRRKLLSPQPTKKKIKPNIHKDRIFCDGDIIAIKLQTNGKPYTGGRTGTTMTEEAFHAYDGKYILMQLVECKASWTSKLVPEVKDFWAVCRLFEGIYNEPPEEINFRELKPAAFYVNRKASPCFTCESNPTYFRRRGAKVLGNDLESIKEMETGMNLWSIFFGINRPWINPDSELLAAMGKASFTEK